MVNPQSYPSNRSIKFMCSYGGRILPRYPNGQLRYHGGHTRVLSVDPSISFSELLVKLREMCGTTSSVSLRCQLPNEDLDALVSITSDEDLTNIIEEYDRFATASTPRKSMKIRAFLSVPKNTTKSPPPSSASSMSSSTSSNEDSATTSPNSPPCALVNHGLPPRCPSKHVVNITNNKPPIYPNSFSGKYYRNNMNAHEKHAAGGYQYNYQCCHHVYVNHWQ